MVYYFPRCPVPIAAPVPNSRPFPLCQPVFRLVSAITPR